MATGGREAVIIKAIVIGDPATGKTSLIKRAIYNDFPETHRPTVGVDFNLKTITVDDKEVKLQLWDIAGACASCQNTTPGTHARDRALCRVLCAGCLGLYEVLRCGKCVGGGGVAGMGRGRGENASQV